MVLGQFQHYVHWQRSEEYAKRSELDLKFWTERLKGELPTLDMPCRGKCLIKQRFIGSRVSLKISEEDKCRLLEVSRDENVSLYTMLLSAYQVLLYLYTDQDEFIIGSAHSLRNQPDLESIFGLMVQTLPLHCVIDPAMTVAEVIQKTRSVVAEAKDHPYFRFEKLVGALDIQGDESGSSMFQTMFHLRRGVSKALSSTKHLKVEEIHLSNGFVKCELEMTVIDEIDGLEVGLEYSSALFEKAFMEQFLSHFDKVCALVVKNLDTSLAELSLIKRDDYPSQIRGLKNIKRNYPLDRQPHEWFEKWASEIPNRSALVGTFGCITYGDLNSWANRLAWKLRGLGIEEDALVAIAMPRQAEMVVSILAIQWSISTDRSRVSN